MATITPFRALRYDPGLFHDLSPVLSPPYDVIDAQEQEALYNRSPHNVVRLILGQESPADSATDNRYTRAARDFAAWQQQGILRREGATAFYLIDHRFQVAGQPHSRLGFLALLEFTDPIEGAVLRHEKTLAAPKEDRTKLLDAVPANLEPIFLVYPDDGGAIQALLRRFAEGQAPQGSGSLGGEEIRLWVVTDAALIRRVAAALAPSAVLIADGHHRFEVAYSRRQRHGAVMAYFASMAEPSLVVRPIHRVVSAGRRLELEAVRGLCAVEPAADLAALNSWLEQERGPGRFGWSDGRRFYRMTVQPDRLERWLKTSPFPGPVARLDVSLLHGLLLPSLGFNGAAIQYTADAGKALGALGSAASVWLLRGIPLADVYDVAAQALTLPPKSTYFYPKVPSGLAINPLA